MPDWVTQLQQLRRLDMPQASLRDLNVADLMQLPHLEQLNLGNFSCDQLDALGPAIVECAYLPVLKCLTYGVLVPWFMILRYRLHRRHYSQRPHQFYNSCKLPLCHIGLPLSVFDN